ncbi:DUF4176 domain-containing protein [Cerasibacillus terrae]|uniref:DUF4176 domain-containing protein n=1 Tax=Cerasibacillus terrae TaxID=2498845 RepID=A0A5C8P028_9BACI|nr:DUF4176 domain-containing protein [Cerasibacillus terrae]
MQAEKKVTWDYVACPYSQGHLSDDTNDLFNRSHIKNVMYKGLETVYYRQIKFSSLLLLSSILCFIILYISFQMVVL